MSNKLTLVSGGKRKTPDGMIEAEAVAISEPLLEILKSIGCRICIEFKPTDESVFLFVPVAQNGDDKKFGFFGFCRSHVSLFLKTLDSRRRGIIGSTLRVGRAALPLADPGAEIGDIGPVALRAVKCSWCRNRGSTTRQADAFSPVTEDLDEEPLRVANKELYLLGFCFGHGISFYTSCFHLGRFYHSLSALEQTNSVPNRGRP